MQLQDESETVMKLVFGGRLLLNGTLGRLWYRLCSWMYPRVWNKTIAQVMAQLFDNSSAEMIFRMTGNLGDLGGNYAQTPFTLLPLLIHHYNDEGGYYPKGGPNSVIAALIPAIEKTGGRCLASAEVKRIIFENDRAVGVVVEKNNNEYEIRCRSGVISSAGVRNTYLKMAPLKDLPSITPKWFLDGMGKILAEIPPSTQHFQVFLGLNKSQKELNLPKYNTWCYPFDLDTHPLTLHSYDEQLETFHRDPINGPPLAFIGFPSAKDPGLLCILLFIYYENRHPGRSVCVIAAETPLYHFQKYANLAPGARGEEYEALKKKLECDWLMWCLSAIDKIEIGTPLTSMHYFGSVMGESYGLDSSLNRFFNFDFSHCLRPKQPIPGLYLAGQDTALWGFTGGMVSGIQTAEAILGYHRWPVILAKRTLIRDLKKMDGVPTDDRDLLP
ncbi:hypothetical protein RFI_15750 [Reticulomyxa filosa]|uniref:Uncharacterized protein n=1 Tax=Reticulomyxa filosa TaxID=46433 RepID=X6N5B3_RETFI|nr:hypothetical protein RFI_15750 [Reticulomyxa filosa]|eukprot:ETO21455.1 hypothetical protein RFI_15750 [Reticulomyxa filosa]